MERSELIGEGAVRETLVGLNGDETGGVGSVPLEFIEFVFGGVRCDRHCGPTKKAGNREREYERGTVIANIRQVSCVSIEECAEIAAELGVAEVPACDLGANLLLEGVPELSKLPPLSTIWFEQGAVMLVTSENMPCKFPGRLLARRYGAERELSGRWVVAGRGRRGLVGIVQHPGLIKPGDRFEVRAPKAHL